MYTFHLNLWPWPQIKIFPTAKIKDLECVNIMPLKDTILYSVYLIVPLQFNFKNGEIV